MPSEALTKLGSGGANLMGADLYRHLNEYFVSHLATTRKVRESDVPPRSLR